MLFSRSFTIALLPWFQVTILPSVYAFVISFMFVLKYGTSIGGHQYRIISILLVPYVRHVFLQERVLKFALLNPLLDAYSILNKKIRPTLALTKQTNQPSQTYFHFKIDHFYSCALNKHACMWRRLKHSSPSEKRVFENTLQPMRRRYQNPVHFSNWIALILSSIDEVSISNSFRHQEFFRFPVFHRSKKNVF